MLALYTVAESTIAIPPPFWIIQFKNKDKNEGVQKKSDKNEKGFGEILLKEEKLKSSLTLNHN